MRNFVMLLISLLTINSATAQLDASIDSLLLAEQKVGFNGNVLFSRNDSIIFIKSLGYADIETKRSLNDSSLFELASCSKQFTALAIVQLVEQGRITYATTADAILKDFPYQHITIEHLLRHQSGLPDYMELLKKKRVWGRKKIATNEDVIGALIKYKPEVVFPPGTAYEYSNTGYMLLASIVERVTSKAYEDYLKQHVFIPAQMHDSRVYRRWYRKEYIQNGTEGHIYSEKKSKLSKVENLKKEKYTYWLDGIVGDGMVNSTLLDLEKWKYALRYNKLISEESKEKMFTTDSISTDYGYGFSVKTFGEDKRIYHGGSWAGYNTLTYYDPGKNEFIAILCNSEYEAFQSFLQRIRNVIKKG